MSKQEVDLEKTKNMILQILIGSVVLLACIVVGVVIKCFYKSDVKTLDEDDIEDIPVPQTESGLSPNPDYVSRGKQYQMEAPTASKYGTATKMMMVDQRPSEMVLVGIPVQPSAQDQA